MGGPPDRARARAGRRLWAVNGRRRGGTRRLREGGRVIYGRAHHGMCAKRAAGDIVTIARSADAAGPSLCCGLHCFGQKLAKTTLCCRMLTAFPKPIPVVPIPVLAVRLASLLAIYRHPTRCRPHPVLDPPCIEAPMARRTMQVGNLRQSETRLNAEQPVRAVRWVRESSSNLLRPGLGAPNTAVEPAGRCAHCPSPTPCWRSERPPVPLRTAHLWRLRLQSAVSTVSLHCQQPTLSRAAARETTDG